MGIVCDTEELLNDEKFVCKYNSTSKLIQLDRIKTKDQELIIPQGVEEISCSINDGVIKIMMPASLEKINYLGMYSSNNLEEITFDKDCKLKYIGIRGISFSKIKHITLPETLEHIDTWAFEWSKNLEEIVFPKALKYCGMNAFGYCQKLKKVVVESDHITLSARQFEGCNELDTVVLNAGVNFFGGSHFIWCYKLKSVDFEGTVKECEKWLEDKNMFLVDPENNIEKFICKDGEVKPIVFKRKDAIDYCVKCGRLYIQQYEAEYNQYRERTTPNSKMYELLNKVSKIWLEEDNRYIFFNELFNWFFTAGSCVSDYIQNPDKDIINAYDKHIIKLYARLISRRMFSHDMAE
ncbi:MAG: leucine-rich repeat domain-containing protein [Clostridiales bacterium]|nr:leucine-rich repeat domain-containing protein [Clostridiales bacterium]